MTKDKMAVVALFTLLTIRYGYADPASDLALAHKFSPILILTEETSGEYGNVRVTKPEPVRIVGARSADSLRFRCYEQHPETNPPWEATIVGFSGWNPTLTFPNVKKIPLSSVPPSSGPGTTVYHRPTPEDIENAKVDSNFLRIDFSNNNFSFLTTFDYIGTPPGMRSGLYKVLPYFDYPGVGPEGKEVPITIYEEGSPRDTTFVTPGWNDTYFGSGPHAGENEDFPNTAYVHVSKTTHETYADSITVIQYFYFYPGLLQTPLFYTSFRCVTILSCVHPTVMACSTAQVMVLLSVSRDTARQASPMVVSTL